MFDSYAWWTRNRRRWSLSLKADLWRKCFCRTQKALGFCCCRIHSWPKSFTKWVKWIIWRFIDGTKRKMWAQRSMKRNWPFFVRFGSRRKCVCVYLYFFFLKKRKLILCILWVAISNQARMHWRAIRAHSSTCKMFFSIPFHYFLLWLCQFTGFLSTNCTHSLEPVKNTARMDAKTR